MKFNTTDSLTNQTVTNSLRRLIKSLSDHKGRRQHGLFTVEGTKCVADTAPYFEPQYLFARKNWLETNKQTAEHFNDQQIFEASAADLQRMSNLTTAPQVIAVYKIPDTPAIDKQTLSGKLVVALDRIQDPGNLGTIMRLCDWMGVDTILASHDTVDLWSPKVIQATMGAISRVKVIYTDLLHTLKNWPSPVYGTFLDAPDIYSASLSANGVIIFGNEGRGISTEISQIVSHRLFIPSFPPDRITSESLNVSTAAAITLSQFRSRQLHSRN